MAGGKVREWIRKRTMPRKGAAGRRSSAGASGASTPILKEAAGSGSGAIGPASAPTAGKAARSGGVSGAPAPASSKVRASVFSSAALLRWWPRVNVLAVLYEKLVYHLLWLVESVVVVARLCFFLMRFGFKQL